MPKMIPIGRLHFVIHPSESLKGARSSKGWPVGANDRQAGVSADGRRTRGRDLDGHGLRAVAVVQPSEALHVAGSREPGSGKAGPGLISVEELVMGVVDPHGACAAAVLPIGQRQFTIPDARAQALVRRKWHGGVGAEGVLNPIGQAVGGKAVGLVLAGVEAAEVTQIPPVRQAIGIAVGQAVDRGERDRIRSIGGEQGRVAGRGPR